MVIGDMRGERVNSLLIERECLIMSAVEVTCALRLDCHVASGLHLSEGSMTRKVIEVRTLEPGARTYDQHSNESPLVSCFD